MAERILAGTAASPGVAAGAARVVAVVTTNAPPVDPAMRPQEGRDALAALEAVAAEMGALAARLRGAGRDEQADLVETAVLIAGDPGLEQDVLARTAAGASAATALLGAADAQAALIAAVDDPMLAARADDVRSVGRRAAVSVAGEPAAQPGGAEVVLVADDLGPADVAELGPEVRAIALARGAVSAHAAIVARSLGVPMVIGLGDAVLGASGTIVLDADAGAAVLEPSDERCAAAREAGAAQGRSRARWLADRALPARTRDGHRVAVLANAASVAEVDVGLSYGAEGAGLIRTELAFLDAPSWPTEDDHRRALMPVLGALAGRTATVRVLDFGADKTPPFLAGTPERGLQLLLRSPDALGAQLRGILSAGQGCVLRILLPMVESAAEVEAAAALLREAAAATGTAVPLLGAMVETPRAAGVASEIAAVADFLSIGTNDLTCATLGVDRFGAGDARAHHPQVLALVARTVRSAHAAARLVEVCGEAASDPLVVPLLVGLGVDELSVGAARVGAVRAWVRDLDHAQAAALAQQALAASDAPAVEALAKAGHAAAQGLDGGARVAAVGA